ncbi:ammonium transporter [Pararhodospirillum oryzae]|uniref:Ammonium transporter n=1 Tax=Pararhodospirillum oryzae TaxID=478448 RepID=A0A512HBE3_9PROT|nr:ammonium transporter [Pararhodospirillum oryzae]GEO82755.1 ammonium transporter [Pararhodospirillum oryzae]
MRFANRPLPVAGLSLLFVALALPALAQDMGLPPAETGLPTVAQTTAAAEATVALDAFRNEVSYIFNSFSFLLHGALVMWMGAGFAMLEGGLVRSKNTAMQMLKNITAYSVAGIMFYIVGYNLMYVNVNGGFIGTLAFLFEPGSGPDLATGHSPTSDWFFQMVFVATAASIVSGTLAERLRFWSFMIFTAVLTGLIYPIQGAWQWGHGWLYQAGFSDFAGSTLVHSVGGWAALVGAVLLGARRGKYSLDGRVNPIPGANLPMATLGTFILWLGWFGFNGGSQLALGSAQDAWSISNIYANTNLAAAAGVVAAIIMTQVLYGKVDLTMTLNGALAGLVSITAEPLMPTPLLAIGIGAVGGVLVVLAVPLLDRLRIDDVVGAIPVHLGCGIWGTLAVPLSNPNTTFLTQLLGVASIGAFVVACSIVVWLALKFTVGLRCSEEEENIGLDKSDLGLEAYPEFGHGHKGL